jgi:hypothetical protein
MEGYRVHPLCRKCLRRARVFGGRRPAFLMDANNGR